MEPQTETNKYVRVQVYAGKTDDAKVIALKIISAMSGLSQGQVYDKSFVDHMVSIGLASKDGSWNFVEMKNKAREAGLSWDKLIKGETECQI